MPTPIILSPTVCNNNSLIEWNVSTATQKNVQRRVGPNVSQNINHHLTARFQPYTCIHSVLRPAPFGGQIAPLFQTNRREERNTRAILSSDPSRNCQMLLLRKSI